MKSENNKETKGLNVGATNLETENNSTQQLFKVIEEQNKEINDLKKINEKLRNKNHIQEEQDIKNEKKFLGKSKKEWIKIWKNVLATFALITLTILLIELLGLKK